MDVDNTSNNNENMGTLARMGSSCVQSKVKYLQSTTKVMCQESISVPAVNLLVLKAPLLPYVLPLRCSFYSLDKPTAESAKDKSYKDQISRFPAKKR